MVMERNLDMDNKRHKSSHLRKEFVMDELRQYTEEQLSAVMGWRAIAGNMLQMPIALSKQLDCMVFPRVSTLIGISHQSMPRPE